MKIGQQVCRRAAIRLSASERSFNVLLISARMAAFGAQADFTHFSRIEIEEVVIQLVRETRKIHLNRVLKDARLKTLAEILVGWSVRGGGDGSTREVDKRAARKYRILGDACALGFRI